MGSADNANWEFDNNEQLRIQTLVEWGVTSVPQHGAVVLRLGYALSQDEWDVYQSTDRPPHQIQAAMSAADARDLGTQLILYAELLDVPASGFPNGG